MGEWPNKLYEAAVLDFEAEITAKQGAGTVEPDNDPPKLWTPGS